MKNGEPGCEPKLPSLTLHAWLWKRPRVQNQSANDA